MDAEITLADLAKEGLAETLEMHLDTSPDLNIDDDARVSPPGDATGAWVQAWVWVSNEG